MLNNLKIGTKLTGGFIIILGLLCVTAGVGYFALKSSTSATEEMMKDEAVLIDITQLRGNFVESQFQLADAALYRKLSNKEEKKTLDEQIREIEERIKGGFKDEDEKTFAKLLEAYDNFYKSGTKWFEKEEERAKTHGAQTTLGGNVEKGMDNYIDAFTKAMEETKTNEGGTEKVSHEYAILSMELGKLRADIEALRRGYYRLLAEADSQKQAAIKTEIDASAGNLEKALEAFEGKIKNEDRRKMFGTVRTSVHDWLETFRKNASLMEEQGTILSDQNARVKEMRELLTTLSGSVEKDVKKIKAATEDTNTLAFNIVFGSAAFAVIIGMVLAYVLSSNITVAIKSACAGVERIAHDGDVAWEVPEEFMRRGDEMGNLAKAVSHILHEIQSVEKLSASLVNFDYDVQMKERGEKDTMNINLNKMIDEINEAIREISEDARQVSTGSGEVSTASQTLSSASQTTAASLEEITATMTEIGTQVKKNAGNATEARDLAKESSKVAVEGQSVMHELTEAMKRITDNSHEIQRVIKMVDDIAFQTNLLALNAAVEAARAGQHGKGFAVVAEEVRNLASRSAKAAKETTELVAKSNQEIERGGEIASHTAGVFDTIVEQIQKTTNLVGDIAVASNEQAQGIGQVSIGLHQIDSATQSNTASAEESASAAHEMSSMAENLQKLVAKFKLRRQGSPPGQVF